MVRHTDQTPKVPGTGVRGHRDGTHGDLGRVCVLQTGRSPDALRGRHGDYDEMCKALLGYQPDEASTYAVVDGAFPTSLDYDLFVITGSRHGVYDDHDWIGPLETLLQNVWRAKKKIIGICFGHQILAQALGGVAEKSDKGFGIGVMDYDLRTNGDTMPVALQAWHQDQVVSPPSGAEVIMSSPFCPIAGLRYGSQALTFQPHPEFSHAYMRDLIEARADVVSDGVRETAFASLSRATDTPVIRDVIFEFVSREVVAC